MQDPTQLAVTATREAIRHLDDVIAGYEAERHALQTAHTAMTHGVDVAVPPAVAAGERRAKEPATAKPQAAKPSTARQRAARTGRKEADLPYDMLKGLVLGELATGEKRQDEMRARLDVSADWFRKATRQMADEGIITREQRGNRAWLAMAAVAPAAPPTNGHRRDLIMAAVLEDPGMTMARLAEVVGSQPASLYQPVDKLVSEGLLRKEGTPAALFPTSLAQSDAGERFAHDGQQKAEPPYHRSEPAVA